MKNKIKIFKQEVIDGLAEKITANTKASSLCKIMPAQPFAANLTIANTKEEDLFYFKSILVSSVWNLNDDVFTVEELWQARATPEDKPLNYEHIPDDIIGHMTHAEVVDAESLSPIPSETAVELLPSKIHIVTSAVLYKFLGREAALSERIDNIIAEIIDNKWFVSMECLFYDFDFALKNEKTGEAKMLKRDNYSSFLTKHLRAYGGEGYYKDWRVGRVLKNVHFCGKGIVKNPANPESIIIASSADNFNAVYCSFNENIFGDKHKMEELELVKKQLADKENEVVELKNKIVNLEQVVSSLEHEKVLANRLSLVVEKLKVAKTEAEAIVEDFKELSDEKFLKVLSRMESKLPQEKPISTEATVNQLENQVTKTPDLTVDTDNKDKDSVFSEIAKYLSKGE